MEVYPGSPYPLGATYDGNGTNFSVFSEAATRVELCLFDDARRREAGRPARADRLLLARLPAQRGPRPALRLPGSRPLRPGPRLPLQPGQASAGSLRQGDRGGAALARGPLPLPFRRPRRPAQRSGQRPVHAPLGGHRPLLRLVQGSPPAAHPARDGHLRGARQGLHACGTRTSPGSFAAPTRPWATRWRSSTSRSWASPRWSCMPVHQFVHDQHLLDRGLRNYWGYNSIAYFAPHAEYSASRQARRARCRSSSTWSRRCTRPASRSSSTWSTTTPPRATTSARCSRSRASTTRPTTG